MYLSATSTKNLIKQSGILIRPYVSAFQGTNMYYCHLGDNILIPQKGLADTRKLDEGLYKKQRIGEYYDLAPGEFLLAETFEVFSTDNSHAIRLFNSSSLARLGVSQCALGMINPGCGVSTPVKLTLELVNNSNFTVRLYPTRKGADKEIDWGTEVLKVAVIEYDPTTESYEDWNGSLYATDTEVQGSLIDRRKHGK